MKKLKTFSSKPMTVCGILLILVAAIRLANAAALEEARVSQVIQDVRLLEAHAASHPAAVNDKVIHGSAVRTGVESRAELTFNDLTITRLGANTIFSFTAGARQAELTQGAILLEVRPGAPPVRANTTAVTVAVMGGTAFLSTGPPSKFMVLEGTGEIYPIGHPEKAATVHAGEMVLTEGGRVSKPEKVDVKLVLATSPLLVDFAPLANLPLIQTVVDQQQAEQLLVVSNPPPYKSMIDTIDVTSANTTANPVVVTNTFGTPSPSPTTSPTITPVPTPSKFGTPSTITSPNPYVITSGTTITTDPSITTNGATDFGKIYRGAMDDGPFTLWAFGSTSAFDTALNIDTQFFADPYHLPIAVFKLQSLSLIGNPTIDTSNNGVTKLGLIGVDGITSGPPGGTLTFTGLDLLLLATVNGSINLTSDVSFQGLNELAMYARGAGSNLILNSLISNIGILELGAEGSIQLNNPGTMSVGEFEATAGNNLTLQIGGSLLLNGKNHLDTLVLPGTTLASGASIALNISGDYTNNSATDSSFLRVRNEGAHIGTGGNIGVNIGGNLTAMNDFNLVVQNTNGQIDNGGNISLVTNGSISTGGELNLLVENYNETANPAGHIGTGGNLSLITGGSLTADFASIAINNRGGGRIDSAVSLTIDIAGALTTLHNGSDFIGNPASLSVAISTRYDDTSGNTTGSFIGGDATLGLHADSASIGGNLSVYLSNRGGTINGNGLLNFNTTHDVTVFGADIPNISDAADIELLNDSGTVSAATPLGGNIHGDATLQVSTANFSVPNGSFVMLINNQNRAVTGGRIDGNATVDLNASSISVGNVFDVEIHNQRGFDATGSNGGSIGGGAVLNIAATSVSAGEFDAYIFNHNAANAISGTGGSIAGSAALSMDITGNVSVTGDFNAEIANQRASGTALGPSGGFIGSDATLNITAGAVSVNGALAVDINNQNNGSGSGAGGNIGGSAAINLNLAGDLSAQGGVNFEIWNGNLVGGSGGFIGSDATVTLHAANLVSAGALFVDILSDNGGTTGSGGTIGSSAGITLSLTQNLTTQGETRLLIANEYGSANSGGSGGSIAHDAVINFSASNASVGGDFTAFIDNARNAGQGGGQIGGNATVNVALAGDMSAVNELLTVNNPGGTIGGAATINVGAGNITANSLVAQIDNTGGSIGANTEAGAIINMNVSGTATVTHDATVAIYGSDGATFSAINFNGGSYNAGGQFLTYIDGNGLITFNNASAHADVLKAGVFGANGVLNVGGGMLSADTTLELYASGSNGQLNFVSNVTLGGNSVKILAANSITIFNNVVVTIGGPNAADVYTNNANYTGFGGNGTTSGTFAGAGANNPQPLANAPPFGPAAAPAHPRMNRTSGGTINVNNTAELLALLDAATVGPDGKVRISDSKNTGSPGNTGRINMNGLPRGLRQMLAHGMRDRGPAERLGGRRL